MGSKITFPVVGDTTQSPSQKAFMHAASESLTDQDGLRSPAVHPPAGVTPSRAAPRAVAVKGLPGQFGDRPGSKEVPSGAKISAPDTVTS